MTGGCPGAQLCLGCSWQGCDDQVPSGNLPRRFLVRMAVPRSLVSLPSWERVQQDGEVGRVGSVFCDPGLVIPLTHPTLQSHFK